jgi:hypothetical protein
MKGIVFILILLPLTLWCKPASADAFACPDYGPPQINVTTDIADPQFDFSLSRAQIDQKFRAIRMPSPQVYHMTINSVMTGPMTADHVTHLHIVTDPRTGKTCVGFDRLDVTLRMRPVVYMASEYRLQACRYKLYFTHELKHVAVDKEVLAQYLPRFQNGLHFAFAGPADSVIGPVPLLVAAMAEKNLEDRVQGAVTSLFDLLMRDRLTRQKDVDSYGEYSRLSNSC